VKKPIVSSPSQEKQEGTSGGDPSSITKPTTGYISILFSPLFLPPEGED